MRLPPRLERFLIGLIASIVLSRPATADGIAGALELPKTVHATSPRRDLYGDPLPPGALMRLGTVNYRQDSSVYRIAYTPDGKHFVTDGQDSIIRVWDAAEGRIIRRIDPGVGALEDYALTTRGKRVMAVGKTAEPGRGFVQNVAMIDLDTGRTDDQASWADEDPGYHPLALCADRHYIAIGINPQGVRVLDAWNGAEIVRFETGHRKPAHIVFSRDGKRLAVETDGEDPQEDRRELRLFDVDQKRELRIISQDGLGLSEPVFSPDGRTIAVPFHLNLHVWDVETGERISFEKAFVDHVGYSADGRTLAGIAGFGSIGVFDLAAR
jgi:dipeptidyl aminopeptidase/acylaminoacyl peptidase